jgi:hypothetical protein
MEDKDSYLPPCRDERQEVLVEMTIKCRTSSSKYLRFSFAAFKILLHSMLSSCELTHIVILSFSYAFSS